MPILPEHKELLLTQSESKTLLQWYDFFEHQYSKNQIYSFCYHKGKKIKSLSVDNNRKYNINQDYFKIWSNNMAYVLGLWYAKGYIYGNEMFDITLHKRDKYILKKAAEELEFQGQLYDSVDQQVVRINFSCKVICDDIRSLGETERKSKLPEIPKEYLPDFIRGYFDGNGSIMELKNNRLNSAFTCGSRQFLVSLLTILREEAGIEGGSFDCSCSSLKFGKRDTLRLGDYIYQNNPELFLLRKKQKFFKEENNR